MLKHESKRDKVWLAVFLGNLVYFAVLALSRCEWADGPFAFVRGCHNFGIDWNSFMAPIGLVVILALPLSLVYWLLRGFQLALHVIRYVVCRLLGRINSSAASTPAANRDATTKRPSGPC